VEAPVGVSSCAGPSAIGMPNWIISLPCPFIGLLDATKVCPAFHHSKGKGNVTEY